MPEAPKASMCQRWRICYFFKHSDYLTYLISSTVSKLVGWTSRNFWKLWVSWALREPKAWLKGRSHGPYWRGSASTIKRHGHPFWHTPQLLEAPFGVFDYMGSHFPLIVLYWWVKSFVPTFIPTKFYERVYSFLSCARIAGNNEDISMKSVKPHVLSCNLIEENKFIAFLSLCVLWI